MRGVCLLLLFIPQGPKMSLRLKENFQTFQKLNFVNRFTNTNTLQIWHPRSMGYEQHIKWEQTLLNYYNFSLLHPWSFFQLCSLKWVEYGQGNSVRSAWCLWRHCLPWLSPPQLCRMLLCPLQRCQNGLCVWLRAKSSSLTHLHWSFKLSHQSSLKQMPNAHIFVKGVFW